MPGTRHFFNSYNSSNSYDSYMLCNQGWKNYKKAPSCLLFFNIRNYVFFRLSFNYLVTILNDIFPFYYRSITELNLVKIKRMWISSIQIIIKPVFLVKINRYTSQAIIYTINIRICRQHPFVAMYTNIKLFG